MNWPPTLGCRDCLTRPGFEVRGTLRSLRLWPFPSRIPDCGDTLWPGLELHLGSGRPLSGCWTFCFLFSVAVTLLFCFFSFFPPVDSALQLERLIHFPLGKHFIRLGEMLSQVTGNSCFGRWPSAARASSLPV